MKIQARVAIVLLFLGATAGLFLRPKPERDGIGMAKAPKAADPPGGDELVLEIFSPEGRRLWRLRLEEARLTTGDVLEAAMVRADYYGTVPPSAITAEELLYEQGPARLFLRRVVVSSPALKLRGGELIWDVRTRSFTLEGGYTLSKDGVTMEGDRLLADEGFGAIRTLGAARLSVPLGRGGAE